jgi:hypothetical protein
MEFAYCVSWHSSIKTNPFYAPYGQECLTHLFISTCTSKVERLNQMITTIQHTFQLVKESMQNAQD